MAYQAPNGNLSEILSELSDKVANSLESKYKCLSKENMCGGIEELNKKIEEENIVIKEKGAEICAEILTIAPKEVDSVDYKEEVKYLIVKMSKEDIESYDIHKYLPSIYTNKGKPTIKYLDKDVIVVKQAISR